MCIYTTSFMFIHMDLSSCKVKGVRQSCSPRTSISTQTYLKQQIRRRRDLNRHRRLTTASIQGGFGVALLAHLDRFGVGAVQHTLVDHHRHAVKREANRKS